MGSVIDYIDCPNCGHEAWDDFYYKTGEEYINCNNCGYHRSATIINREKALNELTDEDWEITELKNPYGAYRLRMVGEVGTTCGSIGDIDGYTSIVEAVQKMTDVEHFSVTRVINGEIVETYLITNQNSN